MQVYEMRSMPQTAIIDTRSVGGFRPGAQPTSRLLPSAGMRPCPSPGQRPSAPAAPSKPVLVMAAAAQPRVEPPELPELPRDVASRFGRRLRQLRLEHAMTQVEVAVHFGIDRTFLSDVERGRKGVCLPTLEVMALGFGLSLAELMRGV